MITASLGLETRLIDTSPLLCRCRVISNPYKCSLATVVSLSQCAWMRQQLPKSDCYDGHKLNPLVMYRLVMAAVTLAQFVTTQYRRRATLPSSYLFELDIASMQWTFTKAQWLWLWLPYQPCCWSGCTVKNS